MTDPTSPATHVNSKRHVPETVPVHDACPDIAQAADSDAASDRANDAVVARGAALLSLLSRRAAAARAEAQCAELRMLLSEAQAGESSRLQHWLRIHESAYSTSMEYSIADPPAAEPLPGKDILRFDASSASHAETVPSGRADDGVGPRQPAETPVADDSPDGLHDWQSLLAPARGRLFAQSQKLKSAPAQVLSEEPQKRPKRSDDGSASHTEDGPLQAKRQAKRQATSGHTDDGSASHHEPQSSHQHHQQHQQRQMRAWRVRGALASLVAHGLLLLLLAWMTLRLPSPPAGLDLQATPVEWVPDALEVSQPMQLSTPDQPSQSDASQPSFDATQVLSQAASDIGPALTGLATPLASGLPSHSLLSARSGGMELLQSSATFFGAAASGNCFCYVVDGSGSMRNGPWEAARHELLKSLASLTEKQRFYIIFFNRELSAIPLPGENAPAPAALYATRENLSHTRRWLDTLRIGIGGPPNDALAMAIDKEPDAIYLLTDGVTSVDVAKFLRERNRISDLIAGEQVRVPIHTIAFYSLDGQAMLQQLAAENAGQFTYVPDPRR